MVRMPEVTEAQLEQFTERVAIMVDSGVVLSQARTFALRDLWRK